MTDDVYRERARLVAHLASLHPSHAGFNDPAEPDWLVVTVETPAGQLSWHIAPADQGLFNRVRRTKPTDRPWDGHTTPDKYERLAQLTRGVPYPGRETHAQDMGDGSRAYATYGAAVGWKTHDGRPMPPWFDLGPTVQAGWMAVGRQARDDVSRETSLVPPMVAVLIDEVDHHGAAHSPHRIQDLVRALKEVYDYGS